MPFGMPKKMGGDSPELVAKMERCVADVMKSGQDKVSAIKICKDQTMKSFAGKLADARRKGS